MKWAICTLLAVVAAIIGGRWAKENFGIPRAPDPISYGRLSPLQPCGAYAPTGILGPVQYVSVNGNDKNSGDKEHPRATIQAAMNALPNGGTVCIAPGTFAWGKARANVMFVGARREP